jgi:hypothetical protein
MLRSDRCQGCEKYRAIFSKSSDGRVRRRSDHDLCMRWYRSYRSAFFAKTLFEIGDFQ